VWLFLFFLYLFQFFGTGFVESLKFMIMATTNPIPQVAPGQVRKRNVFDILDKFKAEGATGKNFLIRNDFNVPMTAEYEITDDSRIRGALPTINAILSANHNCILMSHMGRPKKVQKGEDEDGKERADLTLKHVVNRLSQLVGRPVLFAEDCIGPKAEEAVAALPKEGGAVLLLENLRFHKQEEKNDEAFAKALASLGDAYVNDAFGTCHRAHASVSGVPALMSKELCGVGCLVASEVAYLDFSNRGENEKVAASKWRYSFKVWHKLKNIS
jgi:phosphoglycerate kinase